MPGIRSFRPAAAGESGLGNGASTASNLSVFDRNYAFPESGSSSSGEAVLVIRLARTDHDGLAILVEFLNGDENQAVGAARGHPDDLLRHPKDDEPSDYVAPSSGSDTPTRRRGPYRDSIDPARPRSSRRQRRTAAVVAAGLVLVALIVRGSPSPPSNPASSQTTTTPPVTATRWTYDAQWFAAVGPLNEPPSSCAADTPGNEDTPAPRSPAESSIGTQ